MVVVFILGLLVTLVAPRIIGRTDEARVTKAQADIKAIEEAAEPLQARQWLLPQQRRRHSRLSSSRRRAPAGRTRTATSKVPVDPWGNEYIYQSDGQREVVVKSLGADGTEGGEGYNADIDSRALE